MLKKLISLLLITSIFAQDQDEVSSVFTGSFGSVTLADQIYNHFSFRPEMSKGKLGIGLDLYFYFDNEGNLSDNNWNFKGTNESFKTIVDKIYYVRWGRPADDVYFRFGALPNITLGHGSLIKNYSNSVDYPRVRRKGFTFNYQFGELSAKFVHSDFKEYNAPSLMAGSTEFELFDKLNLNVTIAHDADQLNGLTDRDEDGYPDFVDHFPDDDEYWHDAQKSIEDLYNPSSVLGSGCWGETFGNWPQSCQTQLEGFQNQMSTFVENSGTVLNSKNNQEVSGLSIGMSYDITQRFSIYSEFSQLYGKAKNPYDATHANYDTYDNKLGSGFIPFGFKADWDKITFTFDYRQNTENFLFHYWDQNYDNNRVVIYQNEGDGVTAMTKEEMLYKYGKSNGVQISIASYIKYFGLSFTYAHMNADIWNNDIQGYKSDDNNTLYAKFDIDTSMIERVRIAEIFYQQSHVDDPFDFEPTENSLFGYNLGINMSENMILLLKGRKSYVPDGHITNDDGTTELKYDSIRTTQVETQIIF